MNVDTNLQQSISSTLTKLSTVNNFNMSSNDIAAILLFVNTLVNNVHNTINSSIFENGMFIISFIYTYRRME